MRSLSGRLSGIKILNTETLELFRISVKNLTFMIEGGKIFLRLVTLYWGLTCVSSDFPGI